MLVYAKIENEQTKMVSVGLGSNITFYESIGMELMDVEQSDIDGNWYVAGYALLKSEDEKQKEIIEQAYKSFDSLVEKRLNDFAATRRYNDIYTASNYKDSHIEKYAMEGQYCYKMLAETYAKCEELLDLYMPQVLSGERDIPTWEEIEAQLPVLQWPDEVKTEELSVEEETINESE